LTLAQDITRQFNGDWHGDYGTFPAPGHDPKDRGMSVKDDPGAPDGVLINSFNGGDPLAVKDQCRALGILPSRSADEFRRPNSDTWRVTGSYEYVGTDGTVLYRTQRREKPGERKKFVAERLNGKEWTFGIKGIARVLYRLPDILAATPSEPIYLVEGERKADKLASWGFVATAVAFGANGWQRGYAAALAGRTVIILPDNDDVGRDFAQRARGDLEASGVAVRVIDLPGLPPKGDIIDWTGTPDDLRALVQEGAAFDVGSDWPALDLRACAGSRAPAREWFIDGWIPANKATLLAGDGGVGKSLLAQIKATCIAFGRPFMGMATRQANAAYASWEDDAEELWRRQEAICETMGIPMAALAGRLHLVSYTEEENPFLVTADDKGVRVTPLGRKIERMTERHSIGLLILDNASQIAGIDHNAVDEVAPFAHWLGTLAKRNSGAVVLLHHTNKQGQDFLGSVAYNNQFRSRMLLARPDDCHDLDVRILTNPKANYAQAGNGVELRWFNGAFVRDEDLPQAQRAELAEIGRGNAENAAFLRCLDQRTAERRHVSEKVGANYAPKLFATMPEAKGIKKERLIAAMDRLFRTGVIERGFLWRDTAEGKDIFGLRKTGNVTGNVPENHSADARKPAEKDREIHPVYINISGAALGDAAPLPNSDDDLDTDGDVIGWKG
jgi:RecA-family ATPase